MTLLAWHAVASWEQRDRDLSSSGCHTPREGFTLLRRARRAPPPPPMQRDESRPRGRSSVGAAPTASPGIQDLAHHPGPSQAPSPSHVHRAGEERRRTVGRDVNNRSQGADVTAFMAMATPRPLAAAACGRRACTAEDTLCPCPLRCTVQSCLVVKVAFTVAQFLVVESIGRNGPATIMSRRLGRLMLLVRQPTSVGRRR